MTRKDRQELFRELLERKQNGEQEAKVLMNKLYAATGWNKGE